VLGWRQSCNTRTQKEMNAARFGGASLPGWRSTHLEHGALAQGVQSPNDLVEAQAQRASYRCCGRALPTDMSA